jgi:TPR repeat protein
MTAIVCMTAVVWLAAPWMATWMANWMPNFGYAASKQSTSAAEADSHSNATHESYSGTDIKELRKLAAQGNADAEYALGKRYAMADGMKQDYREAMNWFLAAAEQGNVKAQAKASAFFLAGRGRPQDYSKAYYWALLAQAGGEKNASLYVGQSAGYLSPVQINAEHLEAENWLHTHHIGKASPESSP